jgi:hypothetical protein
MAVETPGIASMRATDLPRRAWRDPLLGSAGAIFAIGLVVLAIGDVLRLIDSLESDRLVGLKIGAGFHLLSPVIGIIALAALSSAFFVARRRRETRLGTGAAILAVAFLTTFASDTILASVYGTHDSPNRVIAALSSEAAGDLALVAAALLATIAFFSSSSGQAETFARRDGLLGWASCTVAISFGLDLVGTILILTLYSDLGATGGLTAGLGINSGGDGVAIAAALVTAIAFFVSRWRQDRARPRWLSQRDGVLGLAFSTFVLGFLLMAIAGVIVAAADPANGFTGKAVAADWLEAVGEFAFMTAAACAAIGFFASVRSRT